jgi:hypothetical protein
LTSLKHQNSTSFLFHLEGATYTIYRTLDGIALPNIQHVSVRPATNGVLLRLSRILRTSNGHLLSLTLNFTNCIGSLCHFDEILPSLSRLEQLRLEVIPPILVDDIIRFLTWSKPDREWLSTLSDLVMDQAYGRSGQGQSLWEMILSRVRFPGMCPTGPGSINKVQINNEVLHLTDLGDHNGNLMDCCKQRILSSFLQVN